MFPRNLPKRIVGNTAWLMGEKGASLAIEILVGAVVARYLGPEKMGIYLTAIAIVNILRPLARVEADKTIVKDLAGALEVRPLLSDAFQLYAMAGLGTFLISCILVVASIPHSASYSDLAPPVVIVLALAFQFLCLPQLWFESRIDSGQVVLNRILILSVSSMAKVLLIVGQAGLMLFALVYLALETVAFGVLNYWKARKQGFPAIGLFRFSDLSSIGRLVSRSLPLLIAALGSQVNKYADLIMLRMLEGNEEAGLYAVASRLCDQLYALSFILAASMFPALVTSRQGGAVHEPNYIRAYFRFSALLAYFVILGSLMLAEPFFELFYGDEYRQSISIFYILVWTVLPIYLGICGGQVIVVHDLGIYMAGIYFSAAVLNVLMNLIAIPIFGVYGAAVVSLMSYFVAYFAGYFMFRKTRFIAMLQIGAMLWPFPLRRKE